MDSTLHYTSVSHTGSLMATINKMRVNSDLCDVTVVVGEYRIMAHRIILSASAPFFYQMLQLHSQPHNENNTDNNNNKEVQLKNIDEIAALKIIEFCYTSAISLDDDTVWPLLAASIKFQLPEICNFCCEFLVAGLDTSNCILSLRLASKVHCPQLEDNCMRFLLENIDQACTSRGLTSLSTPELCSLLSVLALHDVGPATMAKLASVWMEANNTSHHDGVFAQLFQVSPHMAPYLYSFNEQRRQQQLHSKSQSKQKGTGGSKDTTANIPSEDFKSKETSHSRNDGSSSSGKNRRSSTDSSRNQDRSRNSNGNLPREGRQLLDQEREDDKTAQDLSSKIEQGFGMGASREFICISCGDDFDCEEDMLSHQNECDESARMVGSASGDSLREGLLGRKKSNGEKEDASVKGGNSDVCEEGEITRKNDNVSLRKRKLSGEEDSLDNDSRDLAKIGKSSLCAPNQTVCTSGNADDGGEDNIEDTEPECVESNNEGCDVDNKILNSKENGSSSPGDKNVDENLSLSEETKRLEIVDTQSDEPREDVDDNTKDENDHVSCANDNNNNAINRINRMSDKNRGEKAGKGDSFISQLDVVSNTDSDCHEREGKYSTSFPDPDLLSASPSLGYLTESHFKTRRLSGNKGGQDGNRYSSSAAGLSSPPSSSSSACVLGSSSSSSSSLQHLRPQQRCQICGRSFWELKQLSQHWVLDHGIKTHNNNNSSSDDDGVVMNEIADEEQQEQPFSFSLSSSFPSLHHQHKQQQQQQRQSSSKTKHPSSKFSSPGKEIQTDITSIGGHAWQFAASASNYLGQGSVMDSLFVKPGSTFRGPVGNGWEEMLRYSGGSGNDSNPATLEENNMKIGEISTRNGNENNMTVSKKSQQQISSNRPPNEQTMLPDKSFKAPISEVNSSSTTIDHFLGSSSSTSETVSPPSSLKRETMASVKNEIINNESNDLSLSLMAGEAGGHPGMATATNDFLANYLDHYNKLVAQWGLAQVPTFCPMCLTYHPSGLPCAAARSQNSLSSPSSSPTGKRYPHPHQAFSAAAADHTLLDKKSTIKEGGGGVEDIRKKENEEEEEEEKEVNVDGVDDDEEMEEGPLDMSKSSLDSTANNSKSSSSNITKISLSSLSSPLSSSSASSSSSAVSNQFMSLSSSCHPSHHQHNRPPSSSSSSASSILGGIPSFYGYGHFLSANPIMDMSAATMKAAAAVAAAGSLSDLATMMPPRQSPIQDLTSSSSLSSSTAAVQQATGSGSRRELASRDQQQQNYNSYLHHHALSASAIAAQSSSMANNNNNNNNNAASAAAFSSMAAARAQNGLNGGLGLASSHHDISSASSPSSIFSFPSSPPNPNSAAASSHLRLPPSSRLTHPSSSSGGKRKSSSSASASRSTTATAGVPPKQGFPCTVCNRVYSHQSALFTHMRSHSPSTRSYRCQFCNETFARAPDLKVHVCPNGIEKPFTCPSCGQTFAKNIHLKRHLATHSGLKPYPCWVCGKRFSRSDHLKRHTQSIHAGARPHACHVCGKEFVRKYELNKHMTSHN